MYLEALELGRERVALGQWRHLMQHAQPIRVLDTLVRRSARGQLLGGLGFIPHQHLHAPVGDARVALQQTSDVGRCRDVTD